MGLKPRYCKQCNIQLLLERRHAIYCKQCARERMQKKKKEIKRRFNQRHPGYYNKYYKKKK